MMKRLSQLFFGSKEQFPTDPEKRKARILEKLTNYRRKSILGSKSTSSSASTVDKDTESTLEILSDPKHFSKFYFEENIGQNLRNRQWRIKVILTTLKTNKFLVRFGALMKDFDYGPVHAAVLIGPYIFSWNNTSLIVPYRSNDVENGEAAVASIDIENDWKGDREELIRIISQIVTDWNVGKEYSLFSVNCQDFVVAFLGALGIKDPFYPKMKNFLTSIQDNPTGFRYVFPDNGKEIEFHSHQELDKFCMYKDLSAEDAQILKAFDRMFWMKFKTIVHKQDVDQAELDRYRPLGSCPFENPDNNTFLSDE